MLFIHLGKGLVGNVKCFLQVGSESLHHVYDFKTPRVLFMNEIKTTQEMGLVHSNEGVAPFCHGGAGGELKDDVFKSLDFLCPNPQRWS